MRASLLLEDEELEGESSSLFSFRDAGMSSMLHERKNRHQPVAKLRKLSWITTLLRKDIVLIMMAFHILCCFLLANDMRKFVEQAEDSSPTWAISRLESMTSTLSCRPPSKSTCVPDLQRFPIPGSKDLEFELSVFRIGSNAVSVAMQILNSSSTQCDLELNVVPDTWFGIVWNASDSQHVKGREATLFTGNSSKVSRYLLLDTDGIRSAKMLEENICWRCVGQQAAFSLDLQLENLTFSKTDSTLNFLWGVGPQDSVLDNLTPSTINLTSSCDDTNSRLAALEVAQSTEEMTEILIYEDYLFKNPLTLVKLLLDSFRGHLLTAYCRVVEEQRPAFISNFGSDVERLAKTMTLEASSFAQRALAKQGGLQAAMREDNGQGNLKKHNVEAVLRMADSIEPNVEYNVDLDLVEGWLASLHQQFLLVEVIFGLALAAYAGFFLNRNLRRLEPMDPLQLLQTLFSALPQGSMMVSYRWDDRLAAQDPQGLWPRRIAHWFPRSVCWLDIDQLLPGTELKATITKAAANARFRFCFISQGYFKSPNCLLEWEQIKVQPGKCLIFAYDDISDETIDRLRQEGHHVFRLSALAGNELNPLWLISEMLGEGHAKFLFGPATPPINENWFPTLRFWLPGRDCKWLQLPAPLLVGCLVMLVQLIILIVDSKLSQILEYDLQLTMLMISCFFVPSTFLAVAFYIVWYLFGTGLTLPKPANRKKNSLPVSRKEPADLPDAVLLLLFLRHLDIIAPARFFSNSPEVALVVEPLRELGLIACDVEETLDNSDVRVVKVDNGGLEAFVPTPYDSVWSQSGFMDLPAEVRQSLGGFIIEEGGTCSTTIEYISCKMLLHAFSCPSVESLTKGCGSYSEMKLDKQDDASDGSRKVSNILGSGSATAGSFLAKFSKKK